MFLPKKRHFPVKDTIVGFFFFLQILKSRMEIFHDFIRKQCSSTMKLSLFWFFLLYNNLMKVNLLLTESGKILKDHFTFSN